MVETGETPTPDTYFLRRDHGGKREAYSGFGSISSDFRQ